MRQVVICLWVIFISVWGCSTLFLAPLYAKETKQIATAKNQKEKNQKTADQRYKLKKKTIQQTYSEVYQILKLNLKNPHYVETVFLERVTNKNIKALLLTSAKKIILDKVGDTLYLKYENRQVGIRPDSKEHGIFWIDSRKFTYNPEESFEQTTERLKNIKKSVVWLHFFLNEAKAESYTSTDILDYFQTPVLSWFFDTLALPGTATLPNLEDSEQTYKTMILFCNSMNKEEDTNMRRLFGAQKSYGSFEKENKSRYTCKYQEVFPEIDAAVDYYDDQTLDFYGCDDEEWVCIRNAHKKYYQKTKQALHLEIDYLSRSLSDVRKYLSMKCSTSSAASCGHLEKASDCLKDLMKRRVKYLSQVAKMADCNYEIAKNTLDEECAYSPNDNEASGRNQNGNYKQCATAIDLKNVEAEFCNSEGISTEGSDASRLCSRASEISSRISGYSTFQMPSTSGKKSPK